MTDSKLCGVCNKNEASEVCSECGIPLCHECVKVVTIESMEMGQKLLGVTLSGQTPASIQKKVCPKCMKEVDFI